MHHQQDEEGIETLNQQRPFEEDEIKILGKERNQYNHNNDHWRLHNSKDVTPEIEALWETLLLHGLEMDNNYHEVLQDEDISRSERDTDITETNSNGQVPMDDDTLGLDYFLCGDKDSSPFLVCSKSINYTPGFDRLRAVARDFDTSSSNIAPASN